MPSGLIAPRRAKPVTAMTVWLLLCAGLALGQPMAPAPRVTIYDYEVVRKLPMGRDNFVQGLQIVDDTLYVGTGMYGESRLRTYAFPAMELRREVSLDATLFGEGVTRLGDRIYQLTWHAGKIFVYDAASLKLLSTHRISTQGWGITHNGRELLYSDGSDTIRTLDPITLEPKGEIRVTLNGRSMPRLNELEWIEGEIWANVWTANQLVRINPDTGRVTGIVDLRGLLPAEERQEGTDVLNGIAWDEERQALWVTGKRWPWLYQVQLVPRP